MPSAEDARESRNAILRKLRAMLSKTEANGASPAEAETAARLVRTLLAKHKLSMAEVEAHDPSVGTDRFGFVREADRLEPFAEHPNDWLLLLSCGIADAFGAKAVASKDGDLVLWIGRPADVKVCRFLFAYLVRAIRGEWGKFWDPIERVFDRDVRLGQAISGVKLTDRTKLRKDFMIGALVTVCDRLAEQQRREEEITPGLGALVRADRARLDEAVRELGPTEDEDLTPDDLAHSRHGTILGALAGARIPLRQGIGDGASDETAIPAEGHRRPRLRGGGA